MKSAGKIVEPARISAVVETVPRPLVFTNGCFDILHRGHVSYLEEAAALGKALWAALNTDASVRRLGKGAGRPINSLDDRMAVLAGLGCVDFVTWFDEDTPVEIIKLIRPDILVKGGDWPPDSIAGAAEVRAWGGQVRSIAIRYPRSTTALAEKLKSLP